MDDYRNKSLRDIQVGNNKDFEDYQENGSLKDSKYDKREFEFSE